MAAPSPRASSTWYVECLSGISSAGSRVSRRIVFVLDYSLNRIVPALHLLFRNGWCDSLSDVRESRYVRRSLSRRPQWQCLSAGLAGGRIPRVSDGGGHA